MSRKTSKAVPPWATGDRPVSDGARRRGYAGRWKERHRTVGKPLARLNLKPRVLDSGCCVARQMAAARQTGPEGRVGESLKARLPPGVRDHMLVEAQLAAWTDHAVKLRERRVLVGHGASTSATTPASKRLCLAWEAVGDAMRNGDRDRRLGSSALRAFAQVALWLDSNHLTYGCQVVAKVRAAGAHLDHPALQTHEQRAAMLGAAATLLISATLA